MKLIIKLFTLIFICGSLLFAQKNNGLVLLKMDVDARAAAMGGTYTALATDASASFYNPAGLAIAENPGIMASYNDWIWDISHSFAAVQFLNGDHNLSFSFNFLNIPGIAIRGDVPTDEPAGKTDAFNLVAGISYASKYADWQIGGTLKYIFEKYYLTSAPGWAIDLGVLRKNIIDGTDFGLVIQNIGKMSKLKNESSPLPLIVQAGFAYKVPKFFDGKLLITPSMQWISKEQTYFGIGSEFQLVEYLALRGGLKNGAEEIIWSFGVGITYNTFHIDYAYSSLEFDFGNPANMFSLGISY